MTLMRLLVFVLTLCSAPAFAAPATCPWTEPPEVPKFEIVDGAARFTWPIGDPWFGCARAHGGAMDVAFVVRNQSGTVERARLFSRTRANAFESVPVSELCAVGVAAEAQVRVVGTGPMDRLLYETPFVPLPCFSCARPTGAELSARMDDPYSPAGFVTVRGRYGRPLQECAKAAGATLSLRVYVGQSQLEAGTRRDHSFVLRGLEKDAAFRKAFAPTNLCLEGKWIGIEYFGTGEFRQLTIARRETLPLTCPKTL